MSENENKAKLAIGQQDIASDSNSTLQHDKLSKKAEVRNLTANSSGLDPQNGQPSPLQVAEKAAKAEKASGSAPSD